MDMEYLKQFSLDGKVALVTGAAYGIGFAIAKAYAKAGAKIAFNCRGEKHMEEALAAYKAEGIEAKGYYCDVTKEDEVQKMVADIEKKHEERYRALLDKVEGGKVFIAESPLFEITYRNKGEEKTMFAYNEKEKAEILQKYPAEKCTLQRSKGLGENEPEMMNRPSRIGSRMRGAQRTASPRTMARRRPSVPGFIAFAEVTAAKACASRLPNVAETMFLSFSGSVSALHDRIAAIWRNAGSVSTKTGP